MTDRIGVELNVGDLVYDWSFGNRCIILGFSSDSFGKYVKVQVIADDSVPNYNTVKEPGSLLSLECHRKVLPELFL